MGVKRQAGLTPITDLQSASHTVRVKLELFIVSGAKQSDSVISIFLRFSSIIGYYTILSKFSWAIQ